MVSEQDDMPTTWLVARDAEGLSDREIGRILQCDHSTVRRGRPQPAVDEAPAKAMSNALRQRIEAYLNAQEGDGTDDAPDTDSDGTDDDASPDADTDGPDDTDTREGASVDRGQVARSAEGIEEIPKTGTSDGTDDSPTSPSASESKARQERSVRDKAESSSVSIGTDAAAGGAPVGDAAAQGGTANADGEPEPAAAPRLSRRQRRELAAARRRAAEQGPKLRRELATAVLDAQTAGRVRWQMWQWQMWLWREQVVAMSVEVEAVPWSAPVRVKGDAESEAVPEDAATGAGDGDADTDTAAGDGVSDERGADKAACGESNNDAQDGDAKAVKKPLPAMVVPDVPHWVAPVSWVPPGYTLDELKADALSVILEVPVLRELPFETARHGAVAVLEDKVLLVDPPEGFYGDALELLITRGYAFYEDEGAKEIGFAPGGTRYGDTTAEHLRQGVTAEQRRRRYFSDDHYNRPDFIGGVRSVVVKTKTSRDELWRFGSAGFLDKDGQWQPSRGELIAQWRHAASVHRSWGAQKRENMFDIELYKHRSEIELLLLNRNYEMTFQERLYGEGTFTFTRRLGYMTYVRGLQIPTNAIRTRMHIARKRTFRRWVFLPRLPARMLRRFVLKIRLEFAVYIEREDRPRGKASGRGAAWLFRRERLVPLQVRPGRLRWARLPFAAWRAHRANKPEPFSVIRWTVLPALNEAREEQPWSARLMKFLMYGPQSPLDGSSSGDQSDWQVPAVVMGPDYMTPNPRTGYIPSEAYHLRYRHHEYEPGYVPPPEPEPPLPHWVWRAFSNACRWGSRGYRAATWVVRLLWRVISWAARRTRSATRRQSGS